MYNQIKYLQQMLNKKKKIISIYYILKIQIKKIYNLISKKKYIYNYIIKLKQKRNTIIFIITLKYKYN